MKMKRMLLSLTFIVSLGLVFTSCSSNQPDGKGTTTNQISTNDESTKSTNEIKQDNPADTNTNTHTQVSVDSGTNNSQSKDGFSNIAAFWGEFRNAVLSNDISKIEEAARFPIETRGPMDTDPIIKFKKDKFGEVFSIFLAKEAGVLGKTEFDFIKNSEKLEFKNSEDYDKSGNYLKSVRVEGNHTRIGDMEFELVNNSWKLTFIYLDEDSYKKLGVDP